MLKQFFTLLAILCCVNWLYAQDSINVAKDSAKIAQDSARRARRSYDSTLFSDNNKLTTTDYLISLEKAFQTFNQVPILTESFSDLESINNHLTEDDSVLVLMRERLSTQNRIITLRNLQMFHVLLEQLRVDNSDYTKTLDEYDKQLEDLKKEIRNLRKDSVIRSIFRDQALRDTFRLQLEQLRTKFRAADTLIRQNNNNINALKAHTASNTIITKELLYTSENQLKTIGLRIFTKERRYLWESRDSSRRRIVTRDFSKSLAAEKNITEYYFEHTRSQRQLLLVTGLLFFIWVTYNFRVISRLKKKSAIEPFKFRYINPLPISAALLFMFSLAPLFDLEAPSIYIEAIELLLMIILTYFLWKNLPKGVFFFWTLFVIMFLVLTFGRLLLGTSFLLQRYLALVIQIASIVLGSMVLLQHRKRLSSYKIITLAGLLLVLFNFLALICNLFGRTTLSQMFTSTAFYSFVQTLALSFFVRVVTEASLLQIQVSRIRNSYPDKFDRPDIIKNISGVITFLAVIIWLVVLTTNLNIYSIISDNVMAVVEAPRKIGSTTFTFGGIILFLGIIWAANFIQKYIAYFLGDIGDDAALDNRGQRSKLLVTRLILLTCGFLLAVAASGLPIDKITVVLGALGVGIGLGLQSIVNNLVSGIILIFDRPLRIGDVVEVGDKKGRVKEIGIRTSTLLTDDGAEVIIPNGDVLSQNIVNWTLSNNHIRQELTIDVENPANSEDLVMEIKKILEDHNAVIPNKEPEIFTRRVGPDVTEIKLYYWCADVTKTEQVAHDITKNIYDQFEAKGINII